MKKFRENLKRDNILEPGKEGYEEIKGAWNEKFFNNPNPITLELACGRGEYTIGMSRLFPNKNFIGIDLKGDRLWRGSGVALDEKLENAGFLRTQIQFLDKFFEKGEVERIWIVFPDPRPKIRDAKHRLTHNRYLDLYKLVIKNGGEIRLKTDDGDLFDYTLEVLNERSDIENLVYTHDLYNSPWEVECHNIKTRYENIFSKVGRTIKYLRFHFKD